jgi:glyoxylase-like metal-dependent hydrolase (beta-lactamase superfamily II)
VWAWVSSPWTFSTTSYAIEGDDGLVLIDTQFLPRETLDFVDAVEAATRKPARLAVALHANPDKFNGTAALQARGVTVVTSDAVAALIPGVHAKRVRAFGERYAPDYPSDAAMPATFGDAPVTRTDVAGVALDLVPVGGGCSGAHVLAAVETITGRHAFAGDLVANGSHAWLELGLVDDWRRRLDELEALRPDFVHPGRGLSGPHTLIAAQRAYLDDVTIVVAGVDATKSDAVGQAKAAMVSRYPKHRFAVFLDLGLPAVFAAEAVH